MVRILVIHYSQTGQLTRVLHSMLGPLENNADVSVDWRALKPASPHPFPWRFLSFFDVMPECVYQDPPPNEPVHMAPGADYDLVVLGYQVWFLSPSFPVMAFLKSPEARVLRDCRVLTVIGCRNMWVTAHQAMLAQLRNVGARLVDNVVLTDESPLWATFITTPLWLLTGNKGPVFGLQEAGISARTIERSARFGHALRAALPALEGTDDGPFLVGLKAVTVQPPTLLAERIAFRSFRIWGRLIRAAGRPGSTARKPIIAIYVAFLVAIILTLLPFTTMLLAIKARFSRTIRREVAALELPSGSGSECLALYERPT